MSDEARYKPISINVPEFLIPNLKRMFGASINGKLKELEDRAKRTTSGCIASPREINILKENIGEIYSENSSQMKRLKKLEKRGCS